MKILTILKVFLVVLFTAVPALAQGTADSRYMIVTSMATSADDANRSSRSVSNYQWHTGPHDGCAIRGRHVHAYSWTPASGTNTGTSPVGSEKPATMPQETSDMVSGEVMRKLLEKDFHVVEFSDGADLTAEIGIFVRPRLKCYETSHYSSFRRCFSDPERIVHVVLKTEDDNIVAVGSGDDRNIRDAAKEAAEDAANQIKEMKGKKIYIRTH